jgi:ArsR family transcriptional regulator
MGKALPLADAADLFKMLGDRTRLRVLLALARQGEMNVGELSEAVGMNQSALSHHLSLLRMHGIIADRRQSQHRVYALAAGIVPDLLRFVRPEQPQPGEA